MKNKKGFAIIETLITTVVLATALISLYVLFNNMMVKEKRRVYYDDPMYVVRANYLFELFFNILRDASTNPNYLDRTVNFENYLTVDPNNDGNKEKLYMVSFSCDNDVFADKEKCRNFFYKMQLYRIYVSRFDMSYIHTCDKNDTDEKCRTYNLLAEQTKLYFRSLPYVPGAEGYYIIFEFYENGDGNVCENKDCMREYASVKYGGSNTIINVK